jgi:hypothetical protein
VVGRALDVIVLLRADSETILEGLSSAGDLLQAIYVSQAAGAFENVAKLMFIQLYIQPVVADWTPGIRNTSEGFALIQQILQEPSTFDPIITAQGQLISNIGIQSLEHIVEMNPQTRTWATAVINASQSELGALLSAREFLNNWTVYADLLGRDATISLIEQLWSRNLLEELQRDQPSDWLRLVSLLTDALDGSKAARSEAGPFMEWAEESLRAMDRDAWIAQLDQSYSPVWDLITWLDRRGRRPKLGLELEMGLAHHGQKLALGESAFIPTDSTWKIILDTLSDAGTRTSLAIKLITSIADLHGDVAEQFFDVYGEFLASEPSARSHARVFHEVVESGIEKGNLSELNWVVKVAKDFSDFLPPHGSSERSHLRQLLDVAIDEAADGSGLRTALTELASLVKAEK